MSYFLPDFFLNFSLKSLLPTFAKNIFITIKYKIPFTTYYNINFHTHHNVILKPKLKKENHDIFNILI